MKQITWKVEHAAIPCELTRHQPSTVPEVILTFEQGDTTARAAGAIIRPCTAPC